jgi:hypothetical protein
MPRPSAAASSTGNQDHHHTGIGLMTPDQVHYGQIDTVHPPRQVTLDQAFRDNPWAICQKIARSARQTNRNMDQPADAETSRLNACPHPHAPPVVPCPSSVITASRVSTVFTASCSMHHGPAPLRSVT